MHNKTVTDGFLLRNRGEAWAQERLLLRCKPIVISVSREMHPGRAMSYDDLEQVGMIAALQAIKDFDASKGRQFHNYVFKIVRYRIVDAVRVRNPSRKLIVPYARFIGTTEQNMRCLQKNQPSRKK